MDIRYHADGEGLVIDRVCGETQRVEVPPEINGDTVKALAAYAFSDAKPEDSEESAICGMKLREIKLPESLAKIGNYTFYGCRNLENLTMWHRSVDIGGGAFTGCRFLKTLELFMEQAQGHCLKDMLGELRHEVRVILHYKEETAVLLFPEYYEEAVENTPARLLETKFHGSGYHYRQCFRDGKINYTEYDRVFPEAQALESLDFCIELSLLRLQMPYGLAEDARGCYISWLIEHRMDAAQWCIAFEQAETLEYLCTLIDWSASELTALIEETNRKERLQMQSFLMDYKHKTTKKEMRSFEL